MALYRLLLCSLAASGMAGSQAAAEWPQWRGVRGEGAWLGASLPAKLGKDSLEERWRIKVGGGYSGIAVSGGRVLTMDRRKEPAPVERVLCLDAASGKLLWSHEYPADYKDLDHDNGPRATPSVAEGRVYTFGALGNLFCLDLASGKVLFGLDTARLFDSKLPTWGHAASPVVHRDLVLVQAGGRPGGTMMAFDLKTGAERWRALDDRPGYATPVLCRVNGDEQLLVFTADGAWGLDPGTGAARWRFPFRTSEYDVAIVPPVLAGDLVLVSGYWDGAEVFRLAGDASPRSLWKQKTPSCLMATPLVEGRHLYVLDKKQGLLCLEGETGKVLWNDGHRMTPADRNPHASMVRAGDRVAILNSEGHLILARLSPQGYEELGRAPIIGETWAHPAFSGQDVYARSDTEMVCVRVRPGS